MAQGAFVLALAAGLAANGVPIVARILEERGLLRTEVGAVVIVAAACVTALALIASAVAIDGGDASAGGRVAVRIGGGLAVLVLVLALVRRRRLALPPLVGVAAVVALAVASAVAGDRLISSALIGPLVVGVAVQAGGTTAHVMEQRLGFVVRRVLLPVFLGVAALHTDLRELGAGALGPALALIAAVIAIKLAVGYPTARLAGFGSEEARAIGALLQCGGIMTIAISLDVLQAGVIGPRLHATLTLVGLISTIVAGPLACRAPASAEAPVGGARRPLHRPAGSAPYVPEARRGPCVLASRRRTPSANGLTERCTSILSTGGSPTRPERFGAQPGHAQASACGQSRWSGVSR